MQAKLYYERAQEALDKVKVGVAKAFITTPAFFSKSLINFVTGSRGLVGLAATAQLRKLEVRLPAILYKKGLHDHSFAPGLSHIRTIFFFSHFSTQS